MVSVPPLRARGTGEEDPNSERHRIMLRRGDIGCGAVYVPRGGCADDGAVVLGLIQADRTSSSLPGRSHSACSVLKAGALISSLPVPRPAISAGLKFVQRQGPSGKLRQ